jgi:hypothetical protein
MQQKHRYSELISPALRRRMATGAAALALLLVSAAAPAMAAQTAAAAPTRSTLAATALQSGVKLSAVVKTATGATVNTGTVDFLLPNGQSLGSGVVGADGTATLSLARAPQATSKSVDGIDQAAVTAAYQAPAGSTAYSDSDSAALAVTAPDATTQAPGFAATGNPTTVTVKAGSYGTTVLTVNSISGYTGSIEFSCSNLPAQVTCAFNPTQQTLTANGSFASTLQISTQGTSGPQITSMLQGSGTVALAMIFPGALLLIGFAGRRRKLFRGAQMLGLVLLLAGGGIGLSGCSQRYGYLHHPPLTATGTAPGTYTINVAVDGSQGASAIENDIPISLVVQ